MLGQGPEAGPLLRPPASLTRGRPHPKKGPGLTGLICDAHSPVHPALSAETRAGKLGYKWPRDSCRGGSDPVAETLARTRKEAQSLCSNPHHKERKGFEARGGWSCHRPARGLFPSAPCTWHFSQPPVGMSVSLFKQLLAVPVPGLPHGELLMPWASLCILRCPGPGHGL